MNVIELGDKEETGFPPGATKPNLATRKPNPTNSRCRATAARALHYSFNQLHFAPTNVGLVK